MKNQAAVAAFGRGWGALSGQLCRLPSGASAAAAARQAHTAPAGDAMIRWVFLGPPGVGKGTYASRVAERLGVPHIAAGDLVRAEIKSGSALGNEVRAALACHRRLWCSPVALGWFYLNTDAKAR